MPTIKDQKILAVIMFMIAIAYHSMTVVFNVDIYYPTVICTLYGIIIVANVIRVNRSTALGQFKGYSGSKFPSI